MKEIEINAKLKLVGYIVSFFSEELGYGDEYVKIGELDEKIQKIKEKAKNIDSQVEYDYIYVKEIYESDNDFIGLKYSADDDMIVKLKLDPNKRYYIIDKEKIKVEFSDKSKKYEKLKGKKVKSYLVNCCQYYFDSPDTIYEIDGKYYLMSEDLYEIPKEMYDFVKEIIKDVNN